MAAAIGATLVAGTLVHAAQARPGQQFLTAVSHDQRVRADMGSYCWTEPNHTVCADVGRPRDYEPPGPLPVHGDGRIELRPGGKPKRIVVTLLTAYDGGNVVHRGRVRRIEDRRWRLRLPKDVMSARAAFISVQYKQGTVPFDLGLRPHRHSR